MNELAEQYRNDLDEIICNINLRMRPWSVNINDICGIGKNEGGCKKYRMCNKRIQQENTSIMDNVCWAKNKDLDWCNYEGAVSKPYGINCKKYSGIYDYNCPDTPTYKPGRYRNCFPPCPFYGCVTMGEPKREPSKDPCPYAAPYFNSQFSSLHDYRLLYCYLTSEEFIRYQTKYLQLHMGFFAFMDVRKSTKSPDFYYLVKHVLGNCHFYFSKYNELKKTFIWDEEEHLKSVVFQIIREQEFELNHVFKFENAFKGKPNEFNEGMYFNPDGIISLYCFAYICRRITSRGDTEELEVNDITLMIDDKEKRLIDLLDKCGMKDKYLELYKKCGGTYIDSDKIMGVSWIQLLRLLGFINEHHYSTEKFYRFLDEGLLGELQPSGGEIKEIVDIRGKYKTQRIIDFNDLRVIKKVVDTKFNNLKDVEENCPFSIIPNICLRAFETTSRSHIGIPIFEMRNKDAGFFLGTVKDTNNDEMGEFPSLIWTEETKRERFRNLAKLIREVGKAETHDPYYSFAFERGAWKEGKIEALTETATQGGVFKIDPSAPSIPGNLIVTMHQDFLKRLNEIKNYAAYNLPILIHGERGSGKELVAKAIHYHSDRKNGPFLSLNAATLPEGQLEAELFGHRKGIAPDVQERKGRILEADKGTLFIDEIGHMPSKQQTVLNRVVQFGKILQMGIEGEKDVDVRFVFATHTPESINADLRDRMKVHTYIPPLRERKKDIPLLINYFIIMHCEKYNKRHYMFSSEAVDSLVSYNWPGNIRELENLIERITILKENSMEIVDVEYLNNHSQWASRKQNITDVIKNTDKNSLSYICSELAKSNVTQLQKDGHLAINAKSSYPRQISKKLHINPLDIQIGTMWYCITMDTRLTKDTLCTCLKTYQNKLNDFWPDFIIQWDNVIEFLKNTYKKQSSISLEELLKKFKQEFNIKEETV